jgi:hypothetical protein
MTTTGKNRIMIDGPKTDGTYVVEFRTAEGDVLAISIPRTETAVIFHEQPLARRLPALFFNRAARMASHLHLLVRFRWPLG